MSDEKISQADAKPQENHATGGEEAITTLENHATGTPMKPLENHATGVEVTVMENHATGAEKALFENHATTEGAR